jgi:hypothetical protein
LPKYPACIIPYLQADKNIDVADEKFPDCKYIQCFRPTYERTAGTDMMADDPKAVDKAPCHIQVIAPTYRDEELMAAVELIEKVLGE